MTRKSELLTDPFATLQSKTDSRHFVTALSRGLAILDLFTRDVTALGNDEISQRCGLPRSTVTRLTFTLVTTRHLVYMPSVKKYKLGAAALAWSYAAIEQLPGVSSVRPFLQEFANQMEASTVALSLNSGLEMIYVAHCAGPAMLQIRTGVGARLSLWKSATGRTFWAASSDAVKQELMEEIEQLPIDECKSAVTQLRAAEREFQQYGFCTSLGDWRMGVNAVGCPAWNEATPGEKYIVSCGGTNPEYKEELVFNEIGPHLREFARFLMPKLA